MKAFRVTVWPSSSSRDGRWVVYTETGEIVEIGGEKWVKAGKSLQDPDGWYTSLKEALDEAADKIEAAGHAALRQAEELRARSTEPAVS